MSKFAARSTRQEMLDDPSLSGGELERNLEEIALVNRRLGGNDTVLSGVHDLLKGKDVSGGVRFADLGCGSGDLPRLLVRWCRKRNIAVQVTAVDIHPSVIGYARKLSGDYPEITYVCADIFSPEFLSREFDIVTMSLFLHHFPEERIGAIIGNTYRQARWGVVVNDLHRSRRAYYLFKLFTFVTAASAITKHDGLVSILRAFRKAELLKQARLPEGSSYTIRWRWAFRWQLVIRKQTGDDEDGAYKNL